MQVTDDPAHRDPLDLRPCSCPKGDITMGRHGDRRGRTWCVACGGLVLEAHDRPCGQCVHFTRDIGARVMGICGPKLMTVTSDMLVCYYVAQVDLPGRYGCCFEAASTGNSRATSPPESDR